MIDFNNLEQPIQQFKDSLTELDKLSNKLSPKMGAMVKEDVKSLRDMAKDMDLSKMNDLIKNFTKYDTKNNG